MRISPRKAKSQIPNTTDIFLTTVQGEKVTKTERTLDETAELIASQGSLLSSFLKCAAGLSS